jgi:methionine-rich copper-binding protein CopC
MIGSGTKAAELIGFAALVIGASVLGSSAPAEAHNYLIASTPAADSTITTLPAQFEIKTNEPLLTAGGSTSGFALEVRDAAGLYYGDGCVTVSGPSMFATPTLGGAGVYTVLWQVVSPDGHSVSDEYTFTWAPSVDQTVAVGSATPPTCNGTLNGAAAPGPKVPTSSDSRSTRANLNDVLWIGGAILAVLIAGLVTFIILGRRQRRR